MEGCAKQLEYRMMEGSWRSVEVASYLYALAEQARTHTERERERANLAWWSFGERIVSQRQDGSRARG
jgi:hypothetical protein